MPGGEVCLGWVHGGTVRAEFMESVLNLIAGTPLIGRYVTFTAGAHLAAARNNVARLFLEAGTEPWLWMIDTDIVFSPGLLGRLLESADPGRRPVVTGLYWTTTAGGPPLVPMIYDRRAGADPEFTPVSGWHPGGVIRIGGCGAGCLLIHRSVLEVISKAEVYRTDWFTEIRDGARRYGEDLSFCLRAAAAGYPLHADTAAQAGHVKPLVIGMRGEADG